jgi:hypothetical protein
LNDKYGLYISPFSLKFTLELVVVDKTKLTNYERSRKLRFESQRLYQVTTKPEQFSAVILQYNQ